MEQTRKPAGTPDGGQFAPGSKHDPTVTLTAGDLTVGPEPGTGMTAFYDKSRRLNTVYSGYNGTNRDGTNVAWLTEQSIRAVAAETAQRRADATARGDRTLPPVIREGKQGGWVLDDTENRKVTRLEQSWDAHLKPVYTIPGHEYHLTEVNPWDEGMTEQFVSDTINAYKDVALWSSNAVDETGEPVEIGGGEYELSDETVERMREDLADFAGTYGHLIDVAQTVRPDYTDQHVAHDFWLTRNGHGAGFWDRGLGDIGDELTRAAKPFGPMDAYINDDGKVSFDG